VGIFNIVRLAKNTGKDTATCHSGSTCRGKTGKEKSYCKNERGRITKQRTEHGFRLFHSFHVNACLEKRGRCY